MVFKTGRDVPGDGSLTAQNVDSGRGEKNFVGNPLNRRPGPLSPASLSALLGFEKGNNLVFQTQFRVYEEKGQVRNEVLEPAHKFMDLIALDIFGGGGFHFHIEEAALQGGNDVIVPPEASAFAAQAIKRRTGEF